MDLRIIVLFGRQLDLLDSNSKTPAFFGAGPFNRGEELHKQLVGTGRQAWSSGVGRVVIVGAVDFKASMFIARKPELHSNNDPTTLLDAKYGSRTLHELPGVGGLRFAVFSAQLAPGGRRRRVALC